MIASAHRDPAIDDRLQRLLRLEALQLELRRRGHRARARPETPTCWVLLARRHPWPWPRARIFCAGTEGTFVFVTHRGRILADADTDGVRRAADLLTRR